MNVHPIDSRQDRPKLVSAQERGLQSELQLAFVVGYRLTAVQNFHSAFHEAVKPSDTNMNRDVATGIPETFRLGRPWRQRTREYPVQVQGHSIVQMLLTLARAARRQGQQPRALARCQGQQPRAAEGSAGPAPPVGIFSFSAPVGLCRTLIS